MTLLVTINGVDVSTFTESITRDVSLCEVSCGLALQMDTRLPVSPDPYHEVEVVVDGVRYFTGYVNGTTTRRSGGKWVMQVTCDHRALKRLKDYFYHEHYETGDTVPFGLYGTVQHIASKAGCTINFYAGYADMALPKNYAWTDVTLMSFLMDMALFGEMQIAPQNDGTLLMTKANANTGAVTDISPMMKARERRLDDSMFRNMVMIYGDVAAYQTWGYNPYGYIRAAIVSRFMIQTNEKAKEIGDKMITEFNRLLDVEKTTIACRWNVPIAGTARINDPKDGFDDYRIVTRLSDTFDSSGFQEVITTNERCPKIFGFEYYDPYHDHTVVVMHNHQHAVRCANFLNLTEAAVWEDITPAVTPNTIYSLALDPDYKGAWLVTSGAGAAPSSSGGVYRCDDIVTGSFTLKYSQRAAYDDSDALKVSLGQKRDFGAMRSCASFGNGCVCLPEGKWNGFDDRGPSAAFTSADGGGTWTVSLPYYSGGCFWALQYSLIPCHQIDWDGSQLVIVGKRQKNGAPHAGAYVSSPDGVLWTIVHGATTHPNLYSCNIIGGSVYIFDGAGDIITFPSTSFSPFLSNSFGFTRTRRDNSLVYIRHATATNVNTELCQGNDVQLLSGGVAESFTIVNDGTVHTYTTGEVLTLAAPDGGTSATVTITAVAGAVTAASLLTPGTGYANATYATTGGGGVGCTIGVTTDAVPPFGIARILADGEFITVAKNTVTSGKVVTYTAGGINHDRTGNLLSIISNEWEGTVSLGANYMDSSGMEVFTHSVPGRE